MHCLPSSCPTQISTNHPLLHQKILDLLIRLFETSFDELDVLVQVGDLETGVGVLQNT